MNIEYKKFLKPKTATNPSFRYFMHVNKVVDCR